MTAETTMKKVIRTGVRIGICLLVLGAGAFGMVSLAKLKEPPAKTKNSERPISVRAVRVAPKNAPVAIVSHGEARSLNVVDLSPEVAGVLASIHPRLEPGELIPKGEVLFRIDSTNYEADLKESQAGVSERENQIASLEKQEKLDGELLQIYERNKELAIAEYERLKTLFEKDSVGTKARVEAAEQGVNNAASQVQRLSQTIELYPLKIEQAKSGLSSARARLARAEANMERCVVKAPFNARIKQANIEKGQYVAPGFVAATLADDSQLEIQVPLDSLDARRWLRFKADSGAKNAAWFNKLEPVEVNVRWTENPDGQPWKGRLHRVVKFDQQTRTLLVAVRVKAKDAAPSRKDRMPLVDGMFCSVEIPGKELEDVFRLPRAAVSFENTVYASVDGRLKTLPVSVARVDDGFAFVESGLEKDDVIIVSRLVEPLEGSLLKVDMDEAAPDASGNGSFEGITNAGVVEEAQP